ncbi:MAG: hypothetical protein II738_03555 [Clostridia bacterium]|nr:hypothetical protein [Clostridia bacterium]
MKKALSIILAVLLISAIMAPVSLAANAVPPLKTRVYEGTYDPAKTTGDDAITTNQFTLVVSTSKAVKKLTEVSLYVEFDPTVINVASAGEAGKAGSNGEITPNFTGFAAYDMRSGQDNQYAFGWISTSGVTKSAATDLFYITFNVADTKITATTLGVYADTFVTEDGDKTNDVNKTTLGTNPTVNFAIPGDVAPATNPPTTRASMTSPADINALLAIIRKMLDGEGVTFADFADAIQNTLGNSELTMIIEQLVDSDIDISEAFQKILERLGLDFDALRDILNKIIEFLSGLFGGKDTTAATTSNATTNLATTSAGSTPGSEETGDYGLGLAAALFLVGSAGFVITRRKKDEIEA